MIKLLVNCELRDSDALASSSSKTARLDVHLSRQVGNNFPVFFIRDGMKFPDMVHALKPNPKTHIQEGWRIMDFFSHIPESMHMVRLHDSSCSRASP